MTTVDPMPVLRYLAISDYLTVGEIAEGMGRSVRYVQSSLTALVDLDHVEPAGGTVRDGVTYCLTPAGRDHLAASTPEEGN